MEPWRIMDSTPVVVSKWLSVERNTYDRGTEVISDYYVVSRNDFSLVVATVCEDIVLVRQYRPATEKTYVSLPGGYIDNNEAPIVAAQRELQEETGYEGGSWSFVGELHPLPGYIRSRAYVFHCEVGASDLEDFAMKGDFAEGTEPIRLNRRHVLGMIGNGEIVEMQAVAAILLWELKNTGSSQ